MPDPINDIRNGLSDDELKKKYKLSDDDIFTLHKYDYVTSEGGISQDRALKMYPSIGKFISQNTPKQQANPFKEIKGSVLPEMATSKQASESTRITQPKETKALIDEQMRSDAASDALGQVMQQSQAAAGRQRVSGDLGIPVEHVPYKDPAPIPETKPDKTAVKNQSEADAFYETDAGKAYYKLLQPIWKAATETGAKTIAGVARISGNIGFGMVPKLKETTSAIADGLVNYFDFDRRSKEERSDAALYATPTKLQGNLINDGRIDKTKLIPRTVENLTNMAILLTGGAAMGGGKAGLFASSYFNTVEDYRKRGIEVGLKGGQLDAFSNVAAGVTSALELVSPNNPVLDKFKPALLKLAVKDIKSGVSVGKAVYRAMKEFASENTKEVGQELLQNFGDHVVKAVSDELNPDAQFNEDISYDQLKNEVAETALMTILPTTLLMTPNTLRHYKPSTQVVSSLNYAAENQEQFNQAIDKSVQAGTYTPEQAQAMKDNVGIYSTKVQQMKSMGYSPDQSARIAFAAYKDGRINQSDQAIKDSPVLKQTLGEEAKKDSEDLKNDVRDAAMGIPEEGTELSGEDLSKIVQNTPNSPSSLVDEIKGKDFVVDEIDLQEKYDNDPAFKLLVENIKESKEDPEGLRTPPIVDQDGKVLDGNKRLAQQVANGEKTARVFKELKENVSPESELLTLSGITSEEQDKIIAKRKGKTSLTERQNKINSLLQDADRYHAMPAGRLGKDKPEGLKLLNDIKVRATELNLKYDPRSQTFKNETGGKVQKRFLSESNTSIIDNHVPLTERSPETQSAFKTLYNSSPDKANAALFFPNDITGTDGKTLSASQLSVALKDVADGIPSVQAENYLNEFEKMIQDGNVLMVHQGERVAIPIDEYMAQLTEATNEVNAQLSAGELPVSDDVILELLRAREKEMMEAGFEDWSNDNNLDANEPDQRSPQNSQEPSVNSGEVAEPDAGRPAGLSEATIQPTSETGNAQEVFQEVDAPVKNRVGGVQVAPIVGGKPKDLSKIILDVGHGLKQNIFFAKTKARAAGTYAPGSTAIKIKFNGDLDTTAHEVGHALDDKYSIIPDVLANPAAAAELPQFSQFGSKAPNGHANPGQYEANEGFAEFLRALVVNPDETRRIAPEISAIYDSKVPEAARKTLEDFSNDIRTWAGATASDITKANIEFKEEEASTLLKRFFSKEATNKEFAPGRMDWIATQFINPLQMFEKSFKYLKDVKGIDNVLPEDNPILLARLLNGIDGKFGQVLKNGMIDSENNVLKTADGKAKNLNWLLKPLDNTDQKTVEQDMEDVITYMVSERTAELGKRLGRESIISGVGGGIYTDTEVAQKALDEYNNGDPAKLARIQEAAARYREFADDMLKYFVDKGRMSKGQYDEIKANNLQYVAMKRVLETEPGEEVVVFKGQGGKLTSVATPTQKIKGSTKKITNPYASLLDTLHKSLKEADRNDVLRAFRDMLVDSRGMNSGNVKRLADIGVIAQEGDSNTTSIFVDGVLEKWKFQKDIYENLKGLDHDKANLPWYLTILGKVLRETTTKFPVFAVKNWFRDTQDRLIKSNEGSGLKDLFGNPEDWNEVERTGGLNAGYYARSKEAYYGLMDTAMAEVAKKKNFALFDSNRLKNVWDSYEKLLFKSETSNRVAEYRAAVRKAKKEGMDDYNASLYGAFKSRDLIDFAVAGHFMRTFNQIVPFSNAAVQGLRSTAIRARENPGGFLARTTIYSIIPGVLMWLWNHQDDDEAEAYEDMPAYQRDMFWNKKLGPNFWISAPKPYELSVMGAGIDRAMSYAYGNEKAFAGYAGTLAKSFLPFDEASLAGPYKAVIENITNYDFFREKSLIPPNEDGLNLALRNTESASRLGKIVQEAAGLDARKADHMIQNTFSYPGKVALKISDLGTGSKRNSFGFSDFGFFKASPGYNSAPVQEMMAYAKETGLLQSKEYKQFSKMSKEYFMAETDEDIEKAGDELIKYSKELLKKWKDNKTLEKKIAKKTGQDEPESDSEDKPVSRSILP